MTDREYRTSSTDEAAWLHSQGVALLYTVLERGKMVVFVFADDQGEATYHSHQYYQGQPLVNARVLLASHKEIKSAVYRALDRAS